MMHEADVACAMALGVDAIGVIFSSLSSRHVTVANAATLLKNMPVWANWVAVFMNPTVDEVTEVIQNLACTWLQFHGDETAGFCEQFDRPYIKTVMATSTDAITQTAVLHPHAEALLLDTPSSVRGGSGLVFDWGLVPVLRSKPIILAGGLQAGNVAGAIERCYPDAVDVCSGIEICPGKKDHEKMQQFTNAVWRKHD
jgi:phosphoribosylanthranilate isomerase